jgi:hypothetical protein
LAEAVARRTAGALLGVDQLIRTHWPWGAARLERIPTLLRRRIEFGLLVAAIFYAGFSAWSDEHEARVKAEQGAIYRSTDRHLTSEERVRLVTGLRAAGGIDQGIEINSASNCDECEEYAQELRDAINSVSGWKATGGTTIFGSAAIRGVRFNVGSLESRAEPIVKLAKAFEGAKLAFEWIENKDNMPQGYEYYVFVARQLRR